MFSLETNGSLMLYPIGYKTDSFEGVTVIRCFFNNICQYTGYIRLKFSTEYNNHFHSFTVDNSFDISPEQKTYYLGSLKNSEPEPDSGPTEK